MIFSRREDKLTRLIEKQGKRVPSVLFLGAAGVSILGSLVSFIAGKKQFATLVGEWVPTFLLLGMYRRFSKQLA